METCRHSELSSLSRNDNGRAASRLKSFHILPVPPSLNLFSPLPAPVARMERDSLDRERESAFFISADGIGTNFAVVQSKYGTCDGGKMVEEECLYC